MTIEELEKLCREQAELIKKLRRMLDEADDECEELKAKLADILAIIAL